MFVFMKNVSTIKPLLFVLLLLFMAGCSDENSEPIGGISGTGVLLQGTVQNTRALASNEVQIKAIGNPIVQASINSQGEFSVADLPSGSAYLLKVEFTSGEPLYALTYVRNGRQNIHSYSDLAIRNWYAIRGLAIEDAFNGILDLVPNSIPTEEELFLSTNVINSILDSVLIEYNLASVDLSTAEYLADDEGVDEFLDNNPVIIINGDVNIIATNPDTNLQILLTSDLSLDTDLSIEDVTPPSQPEMLRALPTEDSEIVLAWNASTDDIGVSRYNILRDGALIETSTFPVFIDLSVELGAEYSYTVVAIDASGNPSVQSDPALAVIEIDETPPPAPINLVLEPESDSVRIGWDQLVIDDVSSFIIFSNSELIANTTSTFAFQADLASGTQFCYEVFSIDGSGNRSLQSAEGCTQTLEPDEVFMPVINVPEPALEDPVVITPENVTIAGAWGGVVTGTDGTIPLLIDFEMGNDESIAGSYEFPTLSRCVGELSLAFIDGDTYNFAQENSSGLGPCAQNRRVSVTLSTVGSEPTLEFNSFSPTTNMIELIGGLRMRRVESDDLIFGNWGGVADSSDGAVPVLFDIEAGGGSSLLGEFVIPTISRCVGELVFVARENNTYEFYLNNSSNLGPCAQSRRVNLALSSIGTGRILEFNSFDPATNAVQFTGNLRTRDIEPDDFVFGRWGGVVEGEDGAVPVILDIEVGSASSLMGGYEFPTISRCLGEIIFVAIDNENDTYEFFLDNSSNLGPCAQSQRINMRRSSVGLDTVLEFNSFDPATNAVEFTGNMRTRNIEPDDFVFGDWGGLVTGPDGDILVSLDIEAGPGLSLLGSYEYPSVSRCEGEIVFVAKESDRYEFFQNNSSNLGPCAQSARFNLTRTMDGSNQLLDFALFDTDSNLVSTFGALRRQ